MEERPKLKPIRLNKPLFDMVSSGMPGQTDSMSEWMEGFKECYICGKPHKRKHKTCSERCERAYLGDRELRAQILSEVKAKEDR
jgi:predicted nucleic acid-binding Zn ribbon protein